MLAVGSGKGGVGKSTLTLQLTSALSSRGFDCAILDADLNGPSQARLAGLRDVPFIPSDNGMALSRNDEGIGVVTLGAVVPESEAVDFSSATAGDSHVWRATREFTALGQILGSVEWGDLDFLVIDLPPGVERTFQFAEFLGARTTFVLVTVPSRLARGVVARSVAALGRTPNRVLGYIENMSGYYCDECAEVKPLFPSSADLPLGIPCLGTVPFDPLLAAISDRGLSLRQAPDRPAAKAVTEIAGRIAQSLAEEEEA